MTPRELSTLLLGRTCIVDAARPEWARAAAQAGAAVVVVGPGAGAVAAGLPADCRTLVFAGDPGISTDLLALAEMMDECWSEDQR